MTMRQSSRFLLIATLTASLFSTGSAFSDFSERLQDLKRHQTEFKALSELNAEEGYAAKDFYRIFDAKAIEANKVTPEIRAFMERRGHMSTLQNDLILELEAFVMERTHALVEAKMAMLSEKLQQEFGWTTIKGVYDYWQQYKHMMGEAAAKEARRLAGMSEQELAQIGKVKMGSQELTRERNNAFWKYFYLLDKASKQHGLAKPSPIKKATAPLVSLVKAVPGVTLSVVNIPYYVVSRWIFQQYTPTVNAIFTGMRALSKMDARFKDVQVVDYQGKPLKSKDIAFDMKLRVARPLAGPKLTVNIVALTHKEDLKDQYMLAGLHLPHSILFLNSYVVARMFDKSILSPMYAKYLGMVPELISVGKSKSYSITLGGDLKPYEKLLRTQEKRVSNIVSIYPQGFVSTHGETHPISSEFTEKVLGMLRDAGYAINIIPVALDKDVKFLGHYGEKSVPYKTRVLQNITPEQTAFVVMLARNSDEFKRLFDVTLQGLWNESTTDYPEMSLEEMASRIQKATGLEILAGL